MANTLNTDKQIAIIGARAEITVLRIDPATTPVLAVRAFIVQEVQNA